MNVHAEPRWPASLALLACVALYFVLPNRLVIGPRWLIPVLIILVLIPLSLRRHRHPDESPRVRQSTLALIGLVTVANVTSMVMLVQRLLDTSVSQGRALIYSAVSVWLTNVIIYGVWFWEIDRGGPTRRAAGAKEVYDLQFPQLENPQLAPKNWEPKFTDYLYTSFANGTSFAPADAMPLSRRMKVLFVTESMVSFITIAVVAARAVNILK
ncbi:MAG: DUF1345 domain-containing protein [Actinomycetota bacterium]|nr:DUF1345 domain-containing protein [Actinomycetota bacterium]